MAVQARKGLTRKKIEKTAVKSRKAAKLDPAFETEPPRTKPGLAQSKPSPRRTRVVPSKPALPRSSAPRAGASVARNPEAEPVKEAASARGAINVSTLVVSTRNELGLTQELFARLIGVTQRSVSSWETGGPINDAMLRRVREMDRLAAELRKSMREDFIPQWLTSPSEGLGGISPIEAMERGEGDRVWRSAFLLGSGTPL
jgi:DNA-binding XRE family transcriptional regulator